MAALPSGRFRLLRDVVYEVGHRGSPWAITIPKGYETDFASIPWWATWAIPKAGKSNGAALLHDFAYSNLLDLPRSEADFMFRRALVISGVNPFTAWAMFVAVRLGGASAYNAHRSN